MFRLARFSLANRTLVALITLLIAAFGVFSMTQLRQELIPSIELPQTTVVTVVPGASPEVMDQQVSVPIAQAVTDLDGVEAVCGRDDPELATPCCPRDGSRLPPVPYRVPTAVQYSQGDLHFHRF